MDWKSQNHRLTMNTITIHAMEIRSEGNGEQPIRNYNVVCIIWMKQRRAKGDNLVVLVAVHDVDVVKQLPMIKIVHGNYNSVEFKMKINNSMSMAVICKCFFFSREPPSPPSFETAAAAAIEQNNDDSLNGDLRSYRKYM